MKVGNVKFIKMHKMLPFFKFQTFCMNPRIKPTFAKKTKPTFSLSDKNSVKVHVETLQCSPATTTSYFKDSPNVMIT